MWDVVIEMNSSIGSANVLVANLKPLYWAVWLHCSWALHLKTTIKNSELDCYQPWTAVSV